MRTSICLMFNKSLVSIYFLESKIFIVELSANRKNVKNISSFDLPLDIINRGKVQDVPALSAVLKDAWVKSGFKEKSVNIVIPEFSTFTKLLKLPKLNMGELDEAVVWQASQYLPEGEGKMMMDWKLVNKNEGGAEGYEVLVVTIPSDVLMGYVEAAERAELFPYSVSTPSMALTNLTIKEKDPVITIYTSYGETIIVCSEKDKVHGTSALKDYTVGEIVETASRMISHFADLNIKKVYVGGQVDEQFVNEIKNGLGKELAVLNVPLEGIGKDKIQEFLVPIAIQLNKLAEPNDPSTLNLLPSSLVQKYNKEKARIEVWSVTLTITLFVWVSFIIVLASYLYITQQISFLTKRNMANNSVEQVRTRYQNDAKLINETADKILKIKSFYVSPSALLNEIERSKVPGINITIYNMDLDTGSMTMYGTSVTRAGLVDFKKNLEGKPNVKEVKIPINSFEKETNLDFTLSFQYGDSKPKLQNTEVNVGE